MNINFYSPHKEFGCFSNFSPHSFVVENIFYPTSEHYFQSKKFAGTKYEEEVRSCTSPGEAARMGRSRQLPLREDWERVKDRVMYEAVLAKFSQNRECNEVLLATLDHTLTEHTGQDSYWGDGGDGSGKNMLGIILMKVRSELKKELS